MKLYFYLEFRGGFHVEIDETSVKAAIASWACRECRGPLPGRQLQDVHLRHAITGPQQTLGSFDLPVGFFRRSFLEVLCDGEIEKHFEWAAVLGPNGTPNKDWIMAVGHHQLVVRGTDMQQHRYCPQCGVVLYVCRSKKFLYPEPTGKVEIFDAGGGQLIVTDSAMERIRVQKWPRLTVTEIGVAKEPLDGFGDLPFRKPPNDDE